MTTAAASPPINNKREIFGWMMYDWANSAFSTTVVTVFLGPYLTDLAQRAADASQMVYLFGVPIHANSYFGYCVSLSVLLQFFFLPVLGAIADYSHLRKTMLWVFCTLGAAAAGLLFFITPETFGTFWLGGALFIIANVAFGASVVFYNAYLPDIASEAWQDRVSSGGWALGYIGGGLLLLLNLILYTFKGQLGLETGLVVRLSLLSAAVWWFGFAQITFVTLRSRRAARQLPAGDTYLSIGFKQLAATFREIRRFPETLKFLLAYVLYNDGVQAVIVMATIFGKEALGMTSDRLILLILMVQGVAFMGALLFGGLAEWLGAKRAIIFSLFIWSGVVVYAWGFLKVEAEYWVMSVIAALVLGGTQALSRSLFARMIPPGREAEFFSFYEISDRGTSWIGPGLFALVNQIFGGLRYGILSLIVLFISGLLILFFVNVTRAIAEAGRYSAQPAQPEAGPG